jgi:hypothetical protein
LIKTLSPTTVRFFNLSLSSFPMIEHHIKTKITKSLEEPE